MWLLEFENGEKLEERDIGYWDRVPKDKSIKNVKFKVPVLGLDWESGPAEKFVITQVGLSVMSGQQKMIGYCIYYQRDGIIYCLSVKYDGTRHRIVTEDLGIPDHIWRKGVLSK